VVAVFGCDTGADRPEAPDGLMIGESRAFCEVRRLLSRVARYDASVLIEGETGTGKELAARVIHYESARRGGPFVPVNCGAIPDSLLESELFGHRRGAFTDAKEASPGVLLLADGGTLFLDEVDALTAKAQVALLRFLQERRFRPVGAGAERRADVRIVSAANRRLSELADRAEIRRDLFYRLNVLSVELPPLRERDGDVCLLAEEFLRRLARRHGTPVPWLPEITRAWLRRQRWPGNVRELENLIEREFLLSDGAPQFIVESATVADRGGPPPAAPPPDSRTPGPAASPLNYREAKARAMESFDRVFLSQLMAAARGNVTAAARAAGKERRDLGRLLRKYQIQPSAFRG
jgi:two-component system response regulator GlrR